MEEEEDEEEDDDDGGEIIGEFEEEMIDDASGMGMDKGWRGADADADADEEEEEGMPLALCECAPYMLPEAAVWRWR